MNRRNAVLTLFALGSAAGALGVRAQAGPPAQRRTLGVLSHVPTEDAKRYWLDGFHASLKALGWVEGRNLVIERAFANMKMERLPALAEELVRRRVDVIWTFLADAAIAAAQATQTIPIVFVNVAWPIEQGLVDSYARPGRNVTGVTNFGAIEISTKRLEFLKRIAPAATRLSWILGSTVEPTVDGAGFDLRPPLEQAARSLGYEVRFHVVNKSDDLDPAFADILASRAQVLSVAANPVTHSVRERIAAFALSNRLATAFASVLPVEAGGLLSYASAGGPFVMIPRSVEYVDRIFRGARPADLPVERAAAYDLVINVKTAGALGLQVPQALRLQAARVIE